ncbi:MAG: hypothetical protein R3F56_18940 [Planctomycetota bacterium]
MLGYIGPGGALSLIGSFLALLAAVVFAVLGFVWYPIKRLLRRRRGRQGQATPTSVQTHGEA